MKHFHFPIANNLFFSGPWLPQICFLHRAGFVVISNEIPSRLTLALLRIVTIETHFKFRTSKTNNILVISHFYGSGVGPSSSVGPGRGRARPVASLVPVICCEALCQVRVIQLHMHAGEREGFRLYVEVKDVESFGGIVFILRTFLRNSDLLWEVKSLLFLGTLKALDRYARHERQPLRQ